MILLFNLEINISVLLAVKSSFINSWWKRVRLLLEVDSKGKKTSSLKESIERCFGLKRAHIAVGCSERWKIPIFQEGFTN